MDNCALDQESVIKQTVQNMVEAGVIKPSEDAILTAQLQHLDPKDLLTVLLESHILREQSIERISYYPIGSISSN